MLNQKRDKMESYSKSCIFLGYCKGMKDCFFYKSKDGKVFVTTHATFLEQQHYIGTH